MDVVSIGNDGGSDFLNPGPTAVAGFTQAGDGGWTWSKPGGYMDFNLSVPVAGNYGFELIYTAQSSGTVFDVYLNDVLVGKSTILATTQTSGNNARSGVILLTLPVGASKLRLVTGAQTSGGFEILGIESYNPGNPVTHFGGIQKLSLTSPMALAADMANDWFRLPLSVNGTMKNWSVVWSLGYVGFLVQSDQAATYQVTVDYVQQSSTVHSCGGIRVNGVEQAVFEMLSPSGTGTSAPQKITLPAGVSELKFYDHNYFNNVFCYGADWRNITVTPVP